MTEECATGSRELGQPLHSALIGAQELGSIYQIAGRSHHIVSLC